MVQHWVETGQRFERQGCRLLDVGRSTVRYQSKGRDEAARRARLKELAQEYPRYGYPTLHDMLRDEGLVKNSKGTYRIYTEEQLQVRRKKRKKLIRRRLPKTIVCDNGPELWRKHYNEVRPHSSLGRMPPRLFAQRAA